MTKPFSTRRFIFILQFALILGVCVVEVQAQSSSTGFLDRTVTIDGDDYKYQVYVPRTYSADRSWPVILFLHGAGERGLDGLIQTEVGLGSALRRGVDKFPAIIVFPQARIAWQGKDSDVALQALDQTVNEFNTDPDRIYLTGLSMGGHGAYNLAYMDPDKWAALVVICGWISEREGTRYQPVSSISGADAFKDVASRIQSIPMWIFHGEIDQVVPVSESREMNLALLELGADVHYTEFLDVAHNSWDPAYAYEEMVTWLFQQQRSSSTND